MALKMAMCILFSYGIFKVIRVIGCIEYILPYVAYMFNCNFKILIKQMSDNFSWKYFKSVKFLTIFYKISTNSKNFTKVINKVLKINRILGTS